MVSSGRSEGPWIIEPKTHVLLLEGSLRLFRLRFAVSLKGGQQPKVNIGLPKTLSFEAKNKTHKTFRFVVVFLVEAAFAVRVRFLVGLAPG